MSPRIRFNDDYESRAPIDGQLHLRVPEGTEANLEDFGNLGNRVTFDSVTQNSSAKDEVYSKNADTTYYNMPEDKFDIIE